jgi:bacteriophage HK97-gp10 putative tail-component
MGHVTVHHAYNAARMHAILQSPTGGLARDMLKRGVRVQTKARLNLQRPPQRVDTGLLRASIGVQLIFFHGYPAVRVGSNLEYARFVHDGTGIYGPRHHMITPLTSKYLVFKPKGGSHLVFAKSVKGMRPNPFLADALSAAAY